MKSIFLTSLLLIGILVSADAQNSKKEEKEKLKEEQYQEIIALVISEKFEFTGRKANPQQGRQVDLTTRQNYMRIVGKNASGDLPFFGRAYSGGYSSSDGGINFDGPMEAYDVQNNDKKRRIIIKFTVRGEGDNYSCTLTISSMSNASLSVSSTKKQVISYTGVMSAITE